MVQIRHPERLRYEIITARLQTTLSILRGTQGGDRENESIAARRILFHNSCQFEPIHSRHQHVHEDQAWLDVPELIQRVPPIARSDHAPPEHGERSAQKLKKLRMVIDH